MGEPRGIPLRVEHKTTEQVRQEFELGLRKQGAVAFTMDVDGQMQSIVALPEVVRPVAASGDIETKRNLLAKAQREALQHIPELTADVDVYVQVIGTGFDFGDEHYRLDLADAPAELRAAIQAKWDALLRNEQIVDATAPAALHQELAAVRSRYGEIVTAMQSAESQDVGSDEENFPANSRVPYDLNQMNRLPASDQDIFTAYRQKGWANLGKHQRNHYRALKARLEATSQAHAAK